MSRALEREYISIELMAKGDPKTIRKLRDGIMKAHDTVDPGVTQQSMRMAFGVSREVARPVLASLNTFFKSKKDEDLDAAEEAAGAIATRIEKEITQHWNLSPKLDAALREALEVSI